MSTPPLSLIVCTRNRETQLARLLSRLPIAELTRLDVEVIFVDSASTDGTAALLARFGVECPLPIRVVRAERPGVGHARNLGLAEATADLIAFTDDDCYVAEDHPARAIAAFESDALDYAGGRVLLHDDTDAPWTCILREDRFIIPPRSYLPAGSLLGANMVFRRRVFDDAGAFDPDLGAGTPFRCEDIEMMARASRAGFTGAYLPELVVHHHHGRKAGHGALRELQHADDIARGAYFVKSIRAGDRAYVAAWLRRALHVWRLPRTLREVRGGLAYASFAKSLDTGPERADHGQRS